MKAADSGAYGQMRLHTPSVVTHAAMAPFTLETAITRPADQAFAYLRCRRTLAA